MKNTINQAQPIQKTYEFVWEQANKASNQWFALMSRNNYAQAYLFYREGELGVFEDQAPEGWTLGSGERLGAGLTRQQVASKINTIAQRLPFLPT